MAKAKRQVRNVEHRVYADLDTLELERLEEDLITAMKSGDLFTPESFDDDQISKPASSRVQKMIARRDELIGKCRPQCVGDESDIAAAEKDVEAEFGLKAEDWKDIDTDPGGG